MIMRMSILSLSLALAALYTEALGAESLPGTEPLTPAQRTDEIVRSQLGQVLGYWQRRIAQAEQQRDAIWRPALASVAEYQRLAADQRAKCRAMLGLSEGDDAASPVRIEPLGRDEHCQVQRLEIPTPSGTAARAILVAPATSRRHAAIVLCPDADAWPERLLGLDGSSGTPPWLTDLLGRGAIVCVLQSIERLVDHPYCQTTRGKDRRMILYRLGYPVGRTMPGLDVEDALTAVEYLIRRPDVAADRVAVAGVGQGGMTALYAAALEPRIRACVVADYFDRRDRCWAEPVDRRLPGQLLWFGDAELAALIAPRHLAVIAKQADQQALDRIAGEVRRAQRYFAVFGTPERLAFIPGVGGVELVGRCASLAADRLDLPKTDRQVAIRLAPVAAEKAQAVRDQHFEERLACLRALITSSEAKREARWRLTALPADEFPKTQAAMLADYRALVGDIRTGTAPLRVRTELVVTKEKYRAYRVVLDVVDGVEVYGNLLVPNAVSVRCPAVVCQHGLSGTPEMITGLGQEQDTPYHQFGRRLAERGYVVFAPLILHYHPVQWTNDQARMADAVGMMRVAMAVAQTRRVVDFLQTLPWVDPQRIGYYGLSYGGYSALWISPLETRLKAIVVSGHFNDWRSKITADNTATSYLLHPDEDFYNWNILHRFTHVEMVAMMAPRVVCIEYGRRDGITTPEWTAYAWGQLAAIREHLGLKQRFVLAEFDGVHEVHGVESFAFLDRHLASPAPSER